MRKNIFLFLLPLCGPLFADAPNPMIWIEGEAASRKTVIENAGLNAVDPLEFSAEAWISSFSAENQPPGTGEYPVEITEEGKYRLWVRGAGTLACLIDGKAPIEADRSKPIGALSISADGNPGFPTIAWYDMGEVDLPVGKHTIVWQFGKEKGATRYGAMDCFVLSKAPFSPNNQFKPGQGPEPSADFSAAEAWNFTPEKDTFDPNSLLDLRDLNEKTAGENGFIRLAADGQSFVRGDGQPIRFWAAGLRVKQNVPLEEMKRNARFLAKRGVNLVRVFAMLPPDAPEAPITGVNERELDSVFRLVAALKEAGIYSIIDGYWGTHTTIQKGWDVLDSGNKNLGTLVFYDPKTQAAYKAWMKELLTRENPYTGLKLVDDPALAILQLQNEDNLLWWWIANVKGDALKLLKGLYADFLKEKYGSLQKAADAWQEYRSDLPPDDFVGNQPGLLTPWELTSSARKKKIAVPGFLTRTSDQLEFLARLTRKFNAGMVEYLRKELGCRQLINVNNWRTPDLSATMDAQYWADSVGDVMARNIYSGGVHFGVNNGWQILPGHRYSDKSLLKHPEELPTNVKQVAAHPYILSEALWSPPNLYQAESALVVAAQQSLTGLGGVCWFCNFPDEQPANPNIKWTYSTPMQIWQFPLAALMHRKAYLKQGEPAIEEHRSLQSLWERVPPLISEDPGWDPNQDMGTLHIGRSGATALDALAAVVGPVRLFFDENSDKSKVVDLKKYIDRDKKMVRSITGEIETDYGNGVYRVNAPKVQLATGFLGAASPQKLADVEISCKTPYAAVAVASLDDKPINESRKLLVQMGTVARPRGWTTRPARILQKEEWIDCSRVVSVGTLPWQIRNMDATLSIRNSQITKAVALDSNGMPTETKVAVQLAGGKATLALPNGTLYLILTP